MKFHYILLFISAVQSDDVDTIKKAEASFQESEASTENVLKSVKSQISKLDSQFKDAEKRQEENLIMIEQDRKASDASIASAEKDLLKIMNPEFKTTPKTSGEDAKAKGSFLDIEASDFNQKTLFEPLRKAADTIKKFAESLKSDSKNDEGKSSFAEVQRHDSKITEYFGYPVPGSFVDKDIPASVKSMFKGAKEQLEKVQGEVKQQKSDLVKEQAELEKKRETVKKNSKALINAARYIPSFAFLNQATPASSFVETENVKDPMSSLTSSFIERFSGTSNEAEDIKSMERKLQLDREKFEALDKAEKESLESEKVLIAQTREKHEKERSKLNSLNEKLNKQLSQLHRDITLAEKRGSKAV